MNDHNKMANPKETDKKEADKGAKIQVPDEKAEKVAGGAGFWFWDRETKKPKNGPRKGK